MWVRWARLTIVHTIDGLKKKVRHFWHRKKFGTCQKFGMTGKKCQKCLWPPPLISTATIWKVLNGNCFYQNSKWQEFGLPEFTGIILIGIHICPKHFTVCTRTLIVHFSEAGHSSMTWVSTIGTLGTSYFSLNSSILKDLGVIIL